ncbi:hypothetical protein Fmac_025479 [Flemingia macrophylla]|uniref:Uncharacterized protein n=1 Tax=Flemingia macrophylla TaxID=520843 RepID=A0ABD1LSH8_9FABA
MDDGMMEMTPIGDLFSLKWSLKWCEDDGDSGMFCLIDIWYSIMESSLKLLFEEYNGGRVLSSGFLLLGDVIAHVAKGDAEDINRVVSSAQKNEPAYDTLINSFN